MASQFASAKLPRKVNPPTRQSEILQSLVYVVTRIVNTQFTAFATRLVDALMMSLQQSVDSNYTNFCFSASNLIKNDGAGLSRLTLEMLEKVLLREVDVVEHGFKFEMAKSNGELSLVPYEEMENKVLLGGFSRPFEALNADQLAALNIRLAFLLERDALSNSQNPFRPEVFLTALRSAWCAFDPNAEAHALMLPFFRPELFFDLSPIFQALNESLMTRGILPGSVDAFRIKKTESPAEAKKAVNTAVLSQQLKRLFSPEEEGLVAGPANGYSHEYAGGYDGGYATQSVERQHFADPNFSHPHQHNHNDERNPSQAQLGHKAQQAAISSKQLFGFLAELQSRIAVANAPAIAGAAQQAAGQAQNVLYLPKIKQLAPKGSLSRVDESTIDLLTKIFETVFVDGDIPQEIKSLVGFLQIPILKAALKDKEFFYQEEHPARRLIELLTQASIGWEQRKGQDDPLYQAMKRNVGRIQKEYDQEVSLFADVVTELETLIKQEDAASVDAIAMPISHALQQERTMQATRHAKNEVAARIGTGEVIALVETFLEDKWVSVLTVAYGVQEEKPEAVKSAVKTMDDLIWSVKPKITVEQRKEFIAKLPGMLSMLNKWLNVIKWEDADRLQFFAELAECHASIVRAPLELSPERQLEIAVEVAQRAAERRLQRAAKQAPEPAPDASVNTVEGLERGMWLEFAAKDGGKKKVKLAWISPLRSLYIFSTSARQETFSLSSDELAQDFREQRVHVLSLSGMDGKNGLVTHALSRAMADTSVNDAKIKQSAYA
jgi:hypothetical protein